MKASLTLITRSALERAASECDQLGRDKFLAKYGFGPSNRYKVKIPGRARMYDSKAIVGAAAQWTEIGRALGPDEFSGGTSRMQAVFKRNGLELIDMKEQA